MMPVRIYRLSYNCTTKALFSIDLSSSLVKYIGPQRCCHAELRKSDLEVTAHHLNKVEAVQHVHLTNIPVWFGLLGDI